MFRCFSVYTAKTLARLVSRSRGCLLATLMLVPALAIAETATLNFKDADIRALIATVADITGKNFIIDPRINGRVTIISSRPMEKDEIYKVFLSVLEVNGFAAVPAGKAIKIIPDANAKFNDITTVDSQSPGEGDEVVTRVVELRNVQAAQLVPILRPLASPQAHMAAFPENNMLIISDRAANTDRLARLIRSIDRPSTDEIEIIHLQHASAAELVRILTTLEQQNVQTDPTASRTTLIADERTNTILVSGEKANRLRIRATIGQLDTPIDDGGGDTHVVYLRYAKATDLVEVLTGVPVRRGRDRNGDSITFSSNGSQGGSPGEERGTDIPAFAAPHQAGLPRGPLQPGQPVPVAADNPNNQVELKIRADEATNSLVITASPAQFASIQAVIRQLDIRRAQVVVEAVIAEVSVTKAAQLGVQYVFGGGRTGGIVGGTTLNNGVPGIAVDPGTLAASGVSLGLFGSGGVTDLRMLITALLADADSNVLSTPTLVTMDNQEAEIVVGQNVPFLTGTQQTTGGLANPFQTIERQDVGLKLKIKPQINEGDAVSLEIEQEVSSVEASTVSGFITNKRSIKTSVTVDDGKIVVLGGLIDNNHTQSIRKVPVLGDIPGLGALFRSTRSDVTKRNLMVFLHPVIVRDPSTGARIANSKYNYIRAEQINKAAEGVALQPNVASPVLPPIEEILAAPASSGEKVETIIPPPQHNSAKTTDKINGDLDYIPGWRK